MTAGDPGRYVAVRSAADFPLVGKGPIHLGHLDIELTERCNSRCIHCSVSIPAGDRSARRRELNTDQWRSVLSEAAELGVLTVRFTGGEPLMRTDFEELYLFARGLGLRVMVFTNARLITPRLAGLFERVPPLEEVEVTVYGMTPGSYAAVSGVESAFAEFQRGVGLLLERGIPFVVKGVLLPATLGEVDAFEEWAATVPSMDRRPMYSMCFDLRHRRDDEAANERIRRLRMAPGDCVAFFSRDREGYVKEIRRFLSSSTGPPGDVLFPCGAGRSACVDAYGVAQMCLPLRHLDTVLDLMDGGNVRRGALRGALKIDFPRLRETRASDPEYLRRCARCFLKSLCEQCPAKSWMEHGTLDTPVEYLCEVMHAQAVSLGMLNEGESSWEVEDWRERIGWIG